MTRKFLPTGWRYFQAISLTENIHQYRHLLHVTFHNTEYEMPRLHQWKISVDVRLLERKIPPNVWCYFQLLHGRTPCIDVGVSSLDVLYSAEYKEVRLPRQKMSMSVGFFAGKLLFKWLVLFSSHSGRKSTIGVGILIYQWRLSIPVLSVQRSSFPIGVSIPLLTDSIGVRSSHFFIFFYWKTYEPV